MNGVTNINRSDKEVRKVVIGFSSSIGYSVLIAVSNWLLVRFRVVTPRLESETTKRYLPSALRAFAKCRSGTTVFGKASNPPSADRVSRLISHSELRTGLIGNNSHGRTY